jgi:hypothetical protein
MNAMKRHTRLVLGAAILLSMGVGLSGALDFFSTDAFAQSNSDAAAARAMIDKVVVAVRTDRDKALDMFNKGDSGFYIKERDIFPFCFTMSDGKIIATQTKQALGKDLRTFKDATGKAFGQEIYDSVKEGQIAEVSYSFARPGSDQAAVPKVSSVTRIADLGCGVGYYK